MQGYLLTVPIPSQVSGIGKMFVLPLPPVATKDCCQAARLLFLYYSSLYLLPVSIAIQLPTCETATQQLLRLILAGARERGSTRLWQRKELHRWRIGKCYVGKEKRIWQREILKSGRGRDQKKEPHSAVVNGKGKPTWSCIRGSEVRDKAEGETRKRNLTGMGRKLGRGRFVQLHT